MKIIKITEDIIQVSLPTQRELTETFLRFQEHYESPKFRNKVFTLGQFRNWYCKEYGAFTYHEDWNGMNIPSYVLKPFIKGLFDPLTPKEQKFLDLFKGRTGNFYIIGVHEEDKNDALTHEICHGLYYTNSKYKSEVDKVLEEQNLVELKDWLIQTGYCEEVLLDECHAYLSADSEWLEVEKGITVNKSIVQKLIKIRKRYYK